MKARVLNNKRQIQILECSDIELSQLKVYFSRKIRNWRFNPLVKKRLWNGEIKFLSNNLTLSSGLWGELKNMCQEYSFPLELTNKELLIDKNLTIESFKEWIDNTFDENLMPRDYQIESAFKILKYKRSISEIATSAGKTLIMFMVFLYLKDNKFFDTKEIKGHLLNEQMLFIVPSVDLVIQTYEKFEEYSERIKNPIKITIQMFGGSAPKIRKNSEIIIGTFQTLRTLTDDYFQTVKAVCVDEAHYAKSTSVQKVLGKCDYAEYRFGLSGTMKASDETADAFTTQALLGPMINKIPADFLFKNNYATPVEVGVVYLDYLDNNTREKLAHLKKYKNNIEGSELLNLEKKLVISSESRFNYIIDTLSKTTKNSLALFHNVKDNYGKNIYESLKDACRNDTQLYYIDGSVDKDSRERFRNEAINNEEGNYIIVASFGTMSTGIDISNIENIYLLESFKSEVIVKQTIGRGMRLNENKKTVRIFDFVDDYRINDFENYMYKHSKERIELYKKENYRIKKLKINL